MLTTCQLPSKLVALAVTAALLPDPTLAAALPDGLLLPVPLFEDFEPHAAAHKKIAATIREDFMNQS